MLISRLAERRAAGLAVVGEPDPEAVARADEVALSLLRLPPGTSLYDLEQSLGRIIVERRSQLYQQGMEVHRQLVELSIEGRGLRAIVERLAEMTRRVVVFQSSGLQVEYAAAPTGEEARGADAAASLPSGDEVLGQLKGHPPSASSPVVLRLGAGQMTALVSPVVAHSSVGGFLFLLAPEDDLDDVDRVALARASVVCSMELAKQAAVVEAEERLRGDFFDDLLEGRASEEALLSRARHLGCDLARPHAVLVAAPDGTLDGAPGRAMEAAESGAQARAGVPELARSAGRFVAGQKLGAAVVAREREVVALCPLLDPPDLRPARELALALVERLASLAPLSVGIGRYHPGVAGLRTGYAEAEQAIAIGRQLFGPGQVTCFADLGVYRLLFALRAHPDLEDLCRETLAALEEYDAKNGTELVRTLDVYFSHRANLQATADALFLHRNSLAYRLRRIEEVGGLNLDDFDTRFRLQLALKARHVLSARAGAYPG